VFKFVFRPWPLPWEDHVSVTDRMPPDKIYFKKMQKDYFHVNATNEGRQLSFQPYLNK